VCLWQRGLATDVICLLFFSAKSLLHPVPNQHFECLQVTSKQVWKNQLDAVAWLSHKGLNLSVPSLRCVHLCVHLCVHICPCFLCHPAVHMCLGRTPLKPIGLSVSLGSVGFYQKLFRETKKLHCLLPLLRISVCFKNNNNKKTTPNQREPKLPITSSFHMYTFPCPSLSATQATLLSSQNGGEDPKPGLGTSTA
jgi:hypothetical protein